MKKLFQLLKLANAHPGLVGIEVEAEGNGLKEVDNKYWRTENDGSLRGHYPEEKAEFVLKGPIPRKEVSVALKQLAQSLKDAEFDFSYRTSVHVHINVQDLTHTQILNYIYTYLLLEEPLMNYCGKSRKANRFCLRLADAEGMLDIITKMFKDGEGTHVLANDNVRYSDMNLAALGKYGSIEFRGMRGNLDFDVNHTWVEALCNIREYAINQKDPKAILAEIEALGTKGFVTKVLGEVAEAFIYPRMDKDMARSFSISLDLPYAYREKKEVPKGKEEYKILRRGGGIMQVEYPDGRVDWVPDPDGGLVAPEPGWGVNPAAFVGIVAPAPRVRAGLVEIVGE